MNREKILALWVAILMVSPTSELACQWITGNVPGYFLGARIAAMVAVLATTMQVRRFRPLLPFSLAYLYQLALVAARETARNTHLYEAIARACGFIGRTLFLDIVSLLFSSAGHYLVCPFTRPLFL
jgi:hypothetical protein